RRKQIPKMNSRNRFAAAVTGVKADRRAFAGAFSLYGAKLTGCPLERYYNDASLYLDGLSAVVENIATDVILTPLFMTEMAEAFGGKIKYFKNQAPNLIEPAISNLADLPLLKIPDIYSSPRLVYTREVVRGMKQRYGNKKIIGGVLIGPTEIPIMIAGLNNWLSAVIDHSEHIKQMYDITVPLFIEYANNLIAEGADFICMPAAFTTPKIMTRHLVENHTVPILKEVLPEIKKPIYLHHAGAAYNEFLDLLADLPNVEGFITDERDVLRESRTKIGPTTVLMSGLNGVNMDRTTPEEIYDRVKAILHDRIEDPHFVFTLTGPDIPFNTPLENLTAVSDAIREFDGSDP
ncbi:MAG: uroporphyrinogen decarboxylase family protein, partial [Candidatus Thiodiazotropha sp.]